MPLALGMLVVRLVSTPYLTMKKLTITTLAITLLAALPLVSHAQVTGGQGGAALDTPVVATAAEVVASVKGALRSDRKRLVEQAIQNNPDIAGALIAALIAEFPAEAAEYTTTVVAAVIALPVASRSTEQKAAILTTVAQAAVPAALLIPASRVDSVVKAVNAVKDALATVTSGTDPQFANAVGSYTAPLVEGQELILTTPEGSETVIVSGDSLVTS